MPLLHSFNHKIYDIMKKYFFLLSILISGLCSAQNLSYSNVLQAEGKSAKDIYNSVKMWSATAFSSAKNSTQVDDAEKCFISFNSNTDYRYGSISMAAYDGWINFTLTVQSRDGRYKVEMLNIVHENKPTATKSCQLGVVLADEEAYKGFNKKVASDIKFKVAALFDQLCLSLQESVNKEANLAEDEW